MNEKLKELANIAGLGVQHNGIVLTKNVNAAEALANFANLIIVHCIEAVENMPDHCAYTTHQLGIVDCARQQAVDEIKKTFKVNNELVTP